MQNNLRMAKNVEKLMEVSFPSDTRTTSSPGDSKNQMQQTKVMLKKRWFSVETLKS